MHAAGPREKTGRITGRLACARGVGQPPHAAATGLAYATGSLQSAHASCGKHRADAGIALRNDAGAGEPDAFDAHAEDAADFTHTVGDSAADANAGVPHAIGQLAGNANVAPIVGVMCR